MNTQYNIETTVKTLLSDLHTPIGIYLRLRDQYRDTILLESAGNPNNENNYSYIGINPIAGIEIIDLNNGVIKYPNTPSNNITIKDNFAEVMEDFIQKFNFQPTSSQVAKSAQGFYGYISYDAVPFFEDINLETKDIDNISLIRFRLYQYVIAINHYTDEMHLLENNMEGVNSEMHIIEKLLTQKNTIQYPFVTKGQELTNYSDSTFLNKIKEAQRHCQLGNVFQMVLSRRYQQNFLGDEFNVYRKLRSINPSPYLFYFDYGNYKLFGSSPESQIIVKDLKAIMHPIAGTFKRTLNTEKDLQLANELKNDVKENAEHTMLVDLARNDLSKVGYNTRITKLKEIQFFSHVIHMVSEVITELKPEQNPLSIIAHTFPQGTLSGAPKYKVMQLINNIELNDRQFYGGCIGFLGTDGSCNFAIMIRSILSKNNVLTYQAGAGIVAKSSPENELQEVHNKLNALRTAIKEAEKI